MSIQTHWEKWSMTTGRTIIQPLSGDEDMELVWIEPGTFMMGSPESELGRSREESFRHQVTLTKGFYLGKYPITQGQWSAVMGTQPWTGRSYVQSKPSRGSYRVLRGGYFYFRAQSTRSAHRYAGTPDGRGAHFGARLVGIERSGAGNTDAGLPSQVTITGPPSHRTPGISSPTTMLQKYPWPGGAGGVCDWTLRSSP